MARFTAVFQTSNNLTAVLEKVVTLDAKFDVNFMADAEIYSGPYTITPSQSRQTIPTGGYFLEDNIIVEAIPNNYGLITWNGNTLTVS